MKRRDLNTYITLLFVILSSVIQSSLIGYVFFLFLIVDEIVKLFKKDYKSIIEQMILMIPLLGITTINSLPLANLYSFIFGFYILICDKEYGHSKKTFIFFSLFVLFDILKYLIYNNPSVSFINIASLPIFYMSVYSGIVVFEYILKNNNYYEFADKFITGTLFSILFGFISRFLSNGLMFALANDNILTRNVGASGDPNYYGLYIGVSIAFLIIKNRNFRFEVKNYFTAFIFMFMGLSSSSRMYYVIVIFLLCIIFFQILKKIISKDFFKVVIIGVIIFLLLYLSREFLLSNFTYLISRLTTESDISNGRYKLIDMYTQYMSIDFLRQIIGIGIPEYYIRAGAGYAHNLYVEYYVTQGMIGIFAIIIGIFIQLTKKVDVSYLLPLIVIMIGGCGVSFMEVDCFYILFGLVLSKLIGGAKYEKN